MAYSYLWGLYYYKDEMIEMIDEVVENRKNKRLKGLTMSTTFAEDLKNKMMGIEEVMEKILYNSVVEQIEIKNCGKTPIL